MSKFWCLVGYEYKKLWKKKLTWLTVVILLIISVFSACTCVLGDYYINGEIFDSNYHMLKTDQEYAQRLSGRKIDKELIQETVKAYQKVPDVSLYIATLEYQEYARPYSEIFNWIAIATQTGSESLQKIQGMTESKVYEVRNAIQEKQWEEEGNSSKQIEFLKRQESKIVKPIQYTYDEFYENTIELFYTLGVLLVLFISICIPGIFAEEYAKKMTPLIMTSVHGKNSLYRAKIFTAVTFSLGMDLLLILGIAIPGIGIYGLDGFNGMLQNALPLSPWNLTMGQAFLILIGVSMAVSIIHCIIAAFLGELLRSSIGVMAIFMGCLLICMIFNIPEQYKLLAHIWDCIPINITAVWSAFSTKVIVLFDQYFVNWQVVPVVYFCISCALVWIGEKNYVRQKTI